MATRGRKPKLTDEDRSEIQKRVDAGETQASVAEDYGVSQGTVSNLLRDTAVEPPPSTAEDAEWSVIRRAKTLGLDIVVVLQYWRGHTGRCDGCGIDQESIGQSLSLDHDHSSGLFRGLLCQSCNLSLGHSKEDVNRLNGLIQYLNR